MKDIPNEAVIYIKGVIVDENQVVFNNKFVKNVTENNIIVANPAEERRNKTIKIINLVCGDEKDKNGGGGCQIRLK